MSLTPDLARLAARLTTSEVCDLARYGADTLRRRINAGKMPSPVDRGRESLFDRDAVLRALGMVQAETPSPQPSQEWKVDAEAIRATRAKMSRRGRAAKP